MHRDCSIDKETGKPEIVDYYNSTKGGVDCLDQIVRYFSTKRKTNRWPVALFYNMLDIAAYNSFLLYKTKHPEFVLAYKKQARREFLKLLSEELLNPNIIQAEIPNPKICKYNANGNRKWCDLCQRSSRKKTRYACIRCQKYICADHRSNEIFCKNCK